MARCPWYIAGPLLGMVIVGLRAAVNKPLGALGGYIVGAALLAGVAVQPTLNRNRTVEPPRVELSNAVGV